MTLETFWMVYGLHQRGPVHRHKTETSAVEEAKRLARLHPEIEFYVLEAIHRVVKRDVDVTPIHRLADYERHRIHPDDIPF